MISFRFFGKVCRVQTGQRSNGIVYLVTGSQERLHQRKESFFIAPGSLTQGMNFLIDQPGPGFLSSSVQGVKRLAVSGRLVLW